MRLKQHKTGQNCTQLHTTEYIRMGEGRAGKVGLVQCLTDLLLTSLLESSQELAIWRCKACLRVAACCRMATLAA